MKKRMVWFLSAVTGLSVGAWAEVVITSPTGTPDESDVVLEAAVDIVRELPSDTVKVVGDTLGYIGDELRNSTHGVASAFKRKPAREVARDEMLAEASDAWSTTDDIEMRTYTLSKKIGAELVGSENKDSKTVNVSDFFTGIDFPKGTSAFYRSNTGRLVVFNRPANLLAVEQILARYHEVEAEYQEVEINAKFIEVSQSTINELGFKWKIEDFTGAAGVIDATVPLGDHVGLSDNTDVFSSALRGAASAFGGGVPAAGSMVLTKGGWLPLTLAINALEQASDSDVLSAPSLTTLSGEEAEIWVGEDRLVPESFEALSADVNIHIEHQDWDSKLMGVYFSVTPEILDDNIIRLEMKPRIVDYIGEDSYQISPVVRNVHNIYHNRPVQSDVNYAVVARLPYFRVREIETIVNVEDGNTVGLGGLIYDRLETFKDKVPVLGSIPLVGRLFRSEGERSIKRNLMIFVSATQVADNGQRKADLAANN